jgi:AraC-like DNA-binding protein
MTSGTNKAFYLQHMASIRQELIAKIAQSPAGRGDGATAIPWLRLFSRTETTLPNSHIYEPHLSIILQGRKQVTVGEHRFTYDPSCFLLTSVDLPVVSFIAEASEDHPFIVMVAKLDLALIRQLILDYDIRPRASSAAGHAMGTGAVTDSLCAAFARLVDLLDRVDDIPVLSDTIRREIAYHLLKSEQGGRLWHTAMSGSQSNRIHKVILWLRQHYKETLRMNDLADLAAMSVSSMHAHFRDITSLSPVQFQKQLRLQEARRLMLVAGFDAGTAAAEVGYESASHFNREYAKMFGQPPLRDIKNLKLSPLAPDTDLPPPEQAMVFHPREGPHATR